MFYFNVLFRYINAINFRFFMHGENHVCATINVQRQPTMIKLSNCHFKTLKCQPVILGPWSIRAVLLPDQPFINCPSNFFYFNYFRMFRSIIKL